MTINGSSKKSPVQNLVEKVTGIDAIVVIDDIEKAKSICVAAGLPEEDLNLIYKVFGIGTERVSLVDLEKEYNISHPALTGRLTAIYKKLESKKRSFNKLVVSNEKLQEAWSIAKDLPEHEKKLKEAELRFSNFDNQIREKDEMVDKLNTEVARLKRKLTDQETKIEAQNKIIEGKVNLESRIQTLNEKVENNRIELNNRGNRIDKLESDICDLKKENDKLKEELKAANSGINREEVDEAITAILSADEIISSGFEQFDAALNKLWKLTEVSRQVAVVAANSADTPKRVKVKGKK